MLMIMDLMMNSLLQRLHILPRTLETFLGRRARGRNNAEPKNSMKNETTKFNNAEKLKQKVGQSSSNSLGQ